MACWIATNFERSMHYSASRLLLPFLRFRSKPLIIGAAIMVNGPGKRNRQVRIEDVIRPSRTCWLDVGV